MWTYTPVAWVGLKRAFGWGGENTGVEEGGGCASWNARNVWVSKMGFRRSGLLRCIHRGRGSGNAFYTQVSRLNIRS